MQDAKRAVILTSPALLDNDVPSGHLDTSKANSHGYHTQFYWPFLGRRLYCCAPPWLWILPAIQQQSEWSLPGSAVGGKGLKFSNIYIEEEQCQQQEEKEEQRKEGEEGEIT